MTTTLTDAFALSSGQQRLWFLHQVDPNLPLYNIPIAFRIEGDLDLKALKWSLNAVVERHEILRTTFEVVAGEPSQIVHDTLSIELPVEDLQGVSESEQQVRIKQLSEEEEHLSFDLTHGPLLRAKILRITLSEHILLLTIHHIVFDDWSSSIFYRELQTYYAAFRRGMTNVALPELAVQYADYAAWQQQWQEKSSEKQLVYWKQQLKDAPQVLELPLDHPRLSIQTHRGALYRFKFAPELIQKVSIVGQEEEATLFMTLFAAFQVLLARYSGQQDIVVGTPIINRRRVELEGLIGLFMNTLALRTDLTGDPTFRTLLQRVRGVALDAYAHESLPFEKIVEEMHLKRDLSYTPLFQIMFALANVSSELVLPEVTISSLEAHNGTTKFDLSLTITTGPEPYGVIEYSTDLYERETIGRIAQQYCTLLEDIVIQPEKSLDALCIMTADERRKILVGWNETGRDYPQQHLCFPQLFEAQVMKNPDAIAVISDQHVFTYQEINLKANQLAYHLKSLGIGPDIMVGICLPRCSDMLIGLLATFKAGGAYVPFDPAYPPERLTYIQEDTHIPVLLTWQSLAHILPNVSAQIICLDTDWDRIAHECTENPVPCATPQNIAYVIYTSGSTGKPKGVMVPHSALVNFLCSMRTDLAISAQDIFLATTSLSFDIAGLEMYLPLLVGAQVVIASPEIVADGKQLAEVIGAYHCTMMQMTPTAWRLLLETGWQGEPNLKILCGGEALSPQLAQTLGTKGANLVNLYGPTETTIWSLLCRIECERNIIPLGQPIANTQAYILDANLEPVVQGVPGELYIGGAGLARGYHHRPDLTAERFVPDPFNKEAGARLYRTGDLVRYQSGQMIEFLGRLDGQVKIRGFRIELGEIESVLRAHSAVRDAVVTVSEGASDEKQLVAFLVADDTFPVSMEEIRRYLHEKLPGYMMPAVFIFLDAFPLTPNGKVNRKALPIPDHRRPELKHAYVAPRRPIEALLADTWSQVLDVDQIGMYDSLFDLGGDSIRCVQISARMQHVGLSLIPRQLLHHQTIDQLVKDLITHPSSLKQINKIEKFLQMMKSQTA